MAPPFDPHVLIGLVDLLEEAREVGRSAGRAALEAGEELDASAFRPDRSDLLIALQGTVPGAQTPRRGRAMWVGVVLLVAVFFGSLLAWLAGNVPGAPHWWRWLASASIGFGVSVVAVSLARARKRARPAPPQLAYDAGPSSDVPTFRVVALGSRGAGKTVLLASQASELGFPTTQRRYHLSSDLEDARFLAELSSTVRDPSAPWPAATQPSDAREFMFDCKALDSAGQQRTVCRISYLDYAGEMLEPHDWAPPADGLARTFYDADALLLIVDGRAVMQLMDDGPAGHRYFDHQLTPALGLAARASCPVQLLITKWDLVRSYDPSADDNELLRQVSELLMAYPPIQQLVQTRCERQQTVRLIPVSAVGSQFVHLYEDGSMGKRPDGVLHPVNVDMPLYTVIPDLLKRVEWSLDPSVRRELDEAIGRAVVISDMERVVEDFEQRVPSSILCTRR